MLKFLSFKLRHYQRFLRFEPFDLTSEQGIRDERYRRAIFSSFTMLVSRSLSLINGLFTIYIISPIFGAELFSAWNVVIAFLNLMTVFDFGISTAIINRVVSGLSKNRESGRDLISPILTILIFVSLLSSIASAAVALILPWDLILKSHDSALVTETRYAALAGAPFILFGILSAGLTNILLGMQKAFLANILSGLVNIFGLFTIVLASRYSPNLIGMLWASQGLGVMTSMILIFYFYRRDLFNTNYLLRTIPHELGRLWSFGRSFFALNLMNVLAPNLDVFLASTLLDPHSVAELVIVQRLFLIYVGLTSILMTPLWASYADAMVNNDHVFIRKTLFRSLYLAGILILVSLLPSFMFSEKIFFYWSQGTFSPDKYLVFLVAVSAAITMINCAFNYYLNGCGIMRPQMGCKYHFRTSDDNSKNRVLFCIRTIWDCFGGHTFDDCCEQPHLRSDIST